jgi:hypothetical protein
MPRATAALNTLWQIGASIGTALPAVVLQRESAAAMSSAGGGAARLLAPLSAGERAQIGGPVAHRLRPHLHVGGGDGAPGHPPRRCATARRARQPAPERLRQRRLPMPSWNARANAA